MAEGSIAALPTILDHVASHIGSGKQLYAFICSHRDADHIRGVKKLHASLHTHHGHLLPRDADPPCLR